MAARPGEPSTFRRCLSYVTNGFVIGAVVGGSVGVGYGLFSSLRFGLRGAEMFRVLGSSIIQSGGMFGTFMAIGSGIRCK